MRYVIVGLPADFAAKSMGHSLAVHMKHYRRLWGDEPYAKVYKEVMSRKAADSQKQLLNI
jgi:hypothetical protein